MPRPDHLRVIDGGLTERANALRDIHDLLDQLPRMSETEAQATRMNITSLRVRYGISCEEAGIPAEVDEAPKIVLSPSQARGAERALELIAAERPIITMTGEAGTGKTTLARYIIQELPEAALTAPTWQAALRLQQLTGRCAGSLHSVVYQGADLHPLTGQLIFRRRAEGTAPVRSLLGIDEASMVGQRVLTDTLSALPGGLPIFAFGDRNQLPPVKDEPGFDLFNADIHLTEPHRQTEGHPILRFARWYAARQRPLSYGTLAAFGLRPNAIEQAPLTELGARVKAGLYNVVLVATNHERWHTNEAVRTALNFPPMSYGPQDGERVMCLTNQRARQVVNGETGVVIGTPEARVVSGTDCWNAVVDFGGGKTRSILVPRSAWRAKSPGAAGNTIRRLHRQLEQRMETVSVESYHWLEAEYTQLGALTPAYAMTVHKSQGSQFPRGAILLGSKPNRDWRLGYTAVTRFQHKVTFLGSPPDLPAMPP